MLEILVFQTLPFGTKENKINLTLEKNNGRIIK